MRSVHDMLNDPSSGPGVAHASEKLRVFESSPSSTHASVPIRSPMALFSSRFVFESVISVGAVFISFILIVKISSYVQKVFPSSVCTRIVYVL